MINRVAYGALALLVILSPLWFSVGLLHFRHQTTYEQSVPLWTDEALYWHQVESFRRVGLNTGYYTVNEYPTPASWTRYYSWGPFVPMVYAGVSVLTGWAYNTMPIANLLLLVLALAFLVGVARPRPLELGFVGLIVCLFYPLTVYYVTSLLEVGQFACAVVVATCFYKLISAPQNTRWAWLTVAILAGMALLRLSWAFWILPCVWLALSRKKMFNRVLAWVVGGIAVLLALGINAWTTAPFPKWTTLVARLLPTDPQTALTMIGERISKNINDFNTGNTLEIWFRWQVLGLIVACVLLAVWFGYRRQTVRLQAVMVCLFGMTTIMAFNILLYELRDWLDFRLMGSFALCGIIVLVLARVRVMAIVVIMVLLFSTGESLKIFDIWVDFHTENSHERREVFFAWGEALQPHLQYDPNAPSAWCNTLNHTVYYIFNQPTLLMSIDGGIGLSSPLFDPPRLPFQSAYLLLDDEFFAQYGEQLRVQPLLDVPNGKLYRNLDVVCNNAN
jgi:hypothetical protein